MLSSSGGIRKNLNGEPHIEWTEEILTALDDIYYAEYDGDCGSMGYLYHLFRLVKEKAREDYWQTHEY